MEANSYDLKVIRCENFCGAFLNASFYSGKYSEVKPGET
jgi:hypothetical protein